MSDLPWSRWDSFGYRQFYIILRRFRLYILHTCMIPLPWKAGKVIPFKSFQITDESLISKMGYLPITGRSWSINLKTFLRYIFGPHLEIVLSVTPQKNVFNSHTVWLTRTNHIMALAPANQKALFWKPTSGLTSWSNNKCSPNEKTGTTGLPSWSANFMKPNLEIFFEFRWINCFQPFL